MFRYLLVQFMYTVSPKNDTDVAHYTFNAQILVIFSRDVAEGACYRKVICYPISPLLTNVSALPGET